MTSSDDLAIKNTHIVASPVEEDEDPVDAKPEIEEACKNSAECAPAKARYDTCAERVAQNPDDEETCVEEFFDVMHCVHHCVKLLWDFTRMWMLMYVCRPQTRFSIT